MSHAEKCPICGGTGKVSAGFYWHEWYSKAAAEYADIYDNPINCRSCDGKGFIIIQDNDIDNRFGPEKGNDDSDSLLQPSPLKSVDSFTSSNVAGYDTDGKVIPEY